MLALGLAPLVVPSAAYAQKTQEDVLASARKLFAEGLHDEEKGNFAEALEKFRRVAKVKDTVPVRYRIATCLEGLGKLKDAKRAFQAAIDLGSDAKDRDVVRAAKARTDSLSERIPQVTLVLRAGPGQTSQITIDGQPVQPSELAGPIALDPGTHAIAARESGKTAFETQVTLAERARTTVIVPIDTSEPKGAAAEPPPAPMPDGAPRPVESRPGPKPVAVFESGSSRRTAGWITAGAGVAFLIGAGVTLGLRQSDISTIEDACRDGVCPRSREDELKSIRTRAKTEGTIAAVLAGVGVIGVGVGTYLLLSAPRSPRSVSISGRVAPGGGQFVLTTTF